MTEEQIGSLMKLYPRLISIEPRVDWIKITYSNSKSPSTPHVWTSNTPLTSEVLDSYIQYHKELK